MYLQKQYPELDQDEIQDAARPAEVKLWAAVLIQAVKDYLAVNQGMMIKQGTKRVLSDKAKAWIFSDDEKEFNSFVNICRLLNYDPERIRMQLIYRGPDIKEYLRGRRIT
jgi:hypothetical protein